MGFRSLSIGNQEELYEGYPHAVANTDSSINLRSHGGTKMALNGSGVTTEQLMRIAMEMAGQTEFPADSRIHLSLART
jgi:hypothetical protein